MSIKNCKRYTRVYLREADYQPETVQFYRLIDIPFARALRQVGLHQRAPEALDRRQASSVQVLRATADAGAPPRTRSRRR